MEPKRKILLSFNNNIPKNLFQKMNSFSENKKYSSRERQKKSQESRLSSKQIKSYIYFHKIPINENKKEQNIIHKSEIRIDSRTEVRLPLGYIDLSFDNPKNE